MQRRALIHHTIFNMKIAPAEVGYCVMGTTILSLARGQLDSWKRNNFNELNFYHRSRSYSALMWLRMAVPSLNIVPMSPATTIFLSMSPLWIHSFPSTRSYAYIIVLLLSFRFHTCRERFHSSITGAFRVPEFPRQSLIRVCDVDFVSISYELRT